MSTLTHMGCLARRDIRYRKGGAWELIGTGVALAALAFQALQRPQASRWFVLAAGATLLGVFVCLAWRGRLDRRVVVSLGDEGIWWRGWGIARPLPWREIRAARFQMAPKGEPWICLDLHDEARVLADPAFAPAAARARMARSVNATPFSLRATPLEVSNDELMELIQAWLARRPTGQAVA